MNLQLINTHSVVGWLVRQQFSLSTLVLESRTIVDKAYFGLDMDFVANGLVLLSKKIEMSLLK